MKTKTTTSKIFEVQGTPIGKKSLSDIGVNKYSYIRLNTLGRKIVLSKYPELEGSRVLFTILPETTTDLKLTPKVTIDLTNYAEDYKTAFDNRKKEKEAKKIRIAEKKAKKMDASTGINLLK